MPKIVDHDSRRREIIEVVHTMISCEGLGSVTMRGLAAETGYANGALSRYFPDKETLLRAACLRAFGVADERARSIIGERGGLVALRMLCAELMPLDDVRRREARVLLGFWDYAASDAALGALYDAAMTERRGQALIYLRQAESAGETAAGGPAGDLVTDTLFALIMGLQVNCLLSTASVAPDRQLAQIDTVLAPLQSRHFTLA